MMTDLSTYLLVPRAGKVARLVQVLEVSVHHTLVPELLPTLLARHPLAWRGIGRLLGLLDATVVIPDETCGCPLSR